MQTLQDYPDPFGLDAPPFFEDHPSFDPSATTAENMASYISVFLTCRRLALIPPFPPGCAVYSDWPVCTHSFLEKEIWRDPKFGHESKCFLDIAAMRAILEEPSAPRHHVELIATAYSRSNFDSEKLITNFTNIVEHAGLPQHTPPPEIDRSTMNRAIGTVISRWELSGLRSIQRESVPFKENTSAGIGYFGRKGTNFRLALSKADSAIKGFLAHGVDITRRTPYGMLCRLQLSLLTDSKHRNVAADSFHNYLIEGTTASPLYEAMLHCRNPSTFGMTLEDQNVKPTLNNLHPAGKFDVIADWPGFDIGKFSDGRFWNGVRSWEIRLAFGIISTFFRSGDTRGAISLAFSMAYIVFKRITYRKHMWTLTETIPSGSYFVYLLDSIINDFRLEVLSLSLGDPCSARLVGGDDSFNVLNIHFWNTSRVDEIFEPWHTSLAPPPKTQVSPTDSTDPQRFHGHYRLYDSPFRPEFEVLCLCILLERADNIDKELAVARLKGLWLDSGKRWTWLHRALSRLELSIGPRTAILPSHSWYDTMWHCPTVLR